MGGGRAPDYRGYNLQKILPDSVTKGYKVKESLGVFSRIAALYGADLLSAYAMYVMMNYLTNVWNLSITHAAAIINIFDGITSALIIVFAFFVDAFLGDFYMRVLSTIAYIIGFGLLSLSTPTFFGPCSHDKEECIGQKQKVLFFTALPFIAIGIAGHVVGFHSFIKEQLEALAEAKAQAQEDKAKAPIVVETPAVAEALEAKAQAVAEAAAPIVAEAQSQSQADKEQVGMADSFISRLSSLPLQVLELVVTVFVWIMAAVALVGVVIMYLQVSITFLQEAKAQEARNQAETVAPIVAEAQEAKAAAPTTSVAKAEVETVALGRAEAEAQSQSQADQEEVKMTGSFISRLSSLSLQALEFAFTVFIYIMALGIRLGTVAVILVGLAITFLYVKPWSIQFGIPAICAMIATVLFLTGYPLYIHSKPKGSPLTIGLRVFVAAAAKEFQQVKGFKSIYNDDYTLRTNSLRWLEKAATKFPDQAMSKSWTLCTMREVEDTKTGVRMIPLFLTFVGTGLVLSIGNTYFIEQANHMDRRLGKIKIPIPFFKLFDTPLMAEDLITEVVHEQWSNPAPRIIATSMVSSVLCCIVAAGVETKRLDVIRKHGLLDKSNDRIPMTVFYLLPQFILLGVVRVYANAGLEIYLRKTVPGSMRKYLMYFQKFVLGLGSMASVLLVYVVGKLSEINNSPNWFQHTSNRSRLDLYYWTLAGVSVLPLICFIFSSSYKRH